MQPVFDKNAPQEIKIEYYKSVMRKYIDALGAGNPDAMSALFAEDATFEDPVGNETRSFKGINEIRGFFEFVAKRGSHLKLVGTIRGTYGSVVALNLCGTRVGECEIDIISVADFGDDGKIKHYRAHWGPTDIRPLSK